MWKLFFFCFSFLLRARIFTGIFTFFSLLSFSHFCLFYFFSPNFFAFWRRKTRSKRNYLFFNIKAFFFFSFFLFLVLKIIWKFTSFPLELFRHDAENILNCLCGNQFCLWKCRNFLNYINFFFFLFLPRYCFGIFCSRQRFIFLLFSLVPFFAYIFLGDIFFYIKLK